MLFYVFKAGGGYAGLVAHEKALAALFLPDNKPAVLKEIKLKYPDAVAAATPFFKHTAALLQEYFRGEKVSFTGVDCDISSLKPFTRMVLKRTCKIPYGSTNSYKWVGGSKARAAGNALGINPIPIIIPCHRVIRSDESMGGYAYGEKWKRKLLELEAHCLKNN